jgi:glyoxylase-like metal-dependent hydrolase (beta-lactamase superfamily II)
MPYSKVSFDDNLTIYLNGGCNSIVLTSKDKDEALIVDTKWFRSAKALRSTISASKITIINTHFHLDHARGNRLYPSAKVVSGKTNWKQWDIDTGHSKRPDIVLKPGQEASFNMDDETVQAISMGKAHSINDVVVYFEKRKLLAVGDLVFVNMHPVLLDTNGNVASWRRILDKLEGDFEIERVVPGHGKVCNKDSILNMKEYFSSIADAIGNPAELLRLRERYKSYKSFPVISGFERTVHFMKREMALDQL